MVKDVTKILTFKIYYDLEISIYSIQLDCTINTSSYLKYIVHKHKMKYGGQRNDPVYHVTTKRNMTG